MASRNRLGYVRDEIRWYREQARGDTLLQSLGGWLYFLPLLLATLLWWALTRVVAIPYAALRWLVGRLRGRR